MKVAEQSQHSKPIPTLKQPVGRMILLYGDDRGQVVKYAERMAQSSWRAESNQSVVFITRSGDKRKSCKGIDVKQVPLSGMGLETLMRELGQSPPPLLLIDAVSLTSHTSSANLFDVTDEDRLNAQLNKLREIDSEICPVAIIAVDGEMDSARLVDKLESIIYVYPPKSDSRTIETEHKSRFR